jgi:hypothetical protein
MTSLLDLLPELILNIIDQFDTFWRASPDIFDVQDDRTKTLLNLCRTWHYLRNIAQPPLYQLIGVSRHTEAGAFRTLSQLTETVTRRPDLARKTKTLLLKLGGLRTTDGASFLPWKDFSSSERQPVAEDALFNLVPHLKNVTSLKLQTDDRKDDLWKAIWSIESREEQSFPKLQDLSVRPYFGTRQPCKYTPYNYMEHALTNSRSLVNLFDFTSLLTRSTLRKFSLRSGASSPDLELAPRSIYITKLALVDCFMPPKILEILIKACADLRSFQFVRMGLQSEVSYDKILEMTKSDVKTLFELHMAPALAHCKNSLEELILSLLTIGHRSITWSSRTLINCASSRLSAFSKQTIRLLASHQAWSTSNYGGSA